MILSYLDIDFIRTFFISNNMSYNLTTTNTTKEPSDHDNIVGVIITGVVVGPIILCGLIFISYMIHKNCLKPWYKNIKNRIKTYCIWVVKKKRNILNNCYQNQIDRDIRNRENDLNNFEKEVGLGKVKKLTKSEKNEIDSNEICSICFDEIGTKKISKLACGHLFHQKCITQWTQMNEDNHNCPFCRATIENDMFLNK